MALVMMAMLFLLSERIYHKDMYPLLSCADIEALLAHFLPRRDVTEGEVIFQLHQRHLQRQKAIASHARRQKKFPNSMTYRLKPVDCCGRERPLRLKSSKLFG